jgi:hypothetical protein
VLASAGLDAPLALKTDPRLRGAPPAFPPLPPVALGEVRARRVSPSARRQVQEALAAIPPSVRAWAMDEVAILSEVGGGPHVAVQMALLRGAVTRLRDAGVEVVIVEGPLHPAATQLYDASLRRSFLAFAETLREQGVHFVPLESLPPFEAGDFSDLLHTSFTGAARLTRGIVDALRQPLASRSPPSPLP